MLIEANQAHRRIVGQRNVDVSFEFTAAVSLAELVSLDVVAPGERLRIRLIGNDAQGTRQRTRAKQSALGPRQRFDARNVVNMHVECICDGRHRNLIQVHAGRR